MLWIDFSLTPETDVWNCIHGFYPHDDHLFAMFGGKKCKLMLAVLLPSTLFDLTIVTNVNESEACVRCMFRRARSTTP